EIGAVHRTVVDHRPGRPTERNETLLGLLPDTADDLPSECVVLPAPAACHGGRYPAAQEPVALHENGPGSGPGCRDRRRVPALASAGHDDVARGEHRYRASLLLDFAAAQRRRSQHLSS